METETDNLRADIEHYRELLKLVGNEALIETLEIMFAEKERRLLSIEDGQKAAKASARVSGEARPRARGEPCPASPKDLEPYEVGVSAGQRHQPWASATAGSPDYIT